MNIWNFAVEHPFWFSLLVYAIARVLFCCWNRLLRAINIRRHGWPPPHCDADGDLKTED